MNSSHFNRLGLALVALSLGLIFGHDLIPERRLSLHSNNFGIYTDSDGYLGGNSEARFTNETYDRWQCTLRPGVEPPNFPSCRIGISFSKDPENWALGHDFSHFESIRFHYSYTGSAKFLRIHFRNYDEKISSLEDYNSAKFLKLLLRNPGENIDESYLLSEFKLADWWIQQYSVATKDAKNSFDRVTSLEIDFGEPVPYGDHEIEIHQIELRGQYISRDTWYLVILLFWLLAIALFIVIRMRNMYIRNQEQKRHIRDIGSQAEEFRKHSSEYRNMALYDPLTEVFNRTGAQQIIESSFEWRSENNALTLLIIDIDFFKRINDTLGHAGGDKILKELGALLLVSTRSSDTVARWGGEEFIILCPSTPKQASMQFAEKLRLAVEQLRFSEFPDFSITTSIGVTRICEDEDFETAFKRADDALYQAKEQGRNCWVYL